MARECASPRFMQSTLENRPARGKSWDMPMIKLNRTNQGGTFMLNSDQIVSIEVKEKVTTVALIGGRFFPWRNRRWKSRAKSNRWRRNAS
jgi:hypothetical protein